MENNKLAKLLEYYQLENYIGDFMTMGIYTLEEFSQITSEDINNLGLLPNDSDYEKMKAALESLIAKGVDAVYLPEFACPNDRYPELMSIMTSRGIPSFSQVGEEPVSRGVLLGVGAEDMRSYGLFEAKVIDKVIKGVSPRRIGQIYAQNHGMVLNLKTAMEMGWKPPLDMLMTVEKTFTTHRPQVR